MPKIMQGISLSKGKSFADIVKEIQQKKVATASSETVTKTASVKEEIKETEETKKEAKMNEGFKKFIEEKKKEKEEGKSSDKKEDKSSEKKEDKKEDKKECSSSVKTEEKKVEASAPSFLKVAKMTGETKAMLKKYWLNLYPAEYVEAMLAEK